MNTCDTWEFNSAKAKAMRLKAEANRWDARVCELLGDTVGVERHSALAGFMERSARVYDKWARQAPDAPKAEEPATGLKVGTCKVDCGCVSYCRDGLEPAPQPQASPQASAEDVRRMCVAMDFYAEQEGALYGEQTMSAKERIRADYERMGVGRE